MVLLISAGELAEESLDLQLTKAYDWVLMWLKSIAMDLLWWILH